MSKGNEFNDIVKLKAAENAKKFRKLCELKLGESKGKLLHENYELMLQCAQQQKPYPMEGFYTMLYSDIKIANTFYSLLDGDLTLKVIEYLERNKEYLGNRILVEGETSGYVTAFLAYMLPEAAIHCMSWCPPFTQYMDKFLNKLGITNVVIIPGRANRAEDNYQSIVMVRSLVQNMIDVDIRRHAFEALPKVCGLFGQRFKPYFECLTSKVVKGGHIFDFEQDYGTPFAGALMQMSDLGFDIFDLEKLDFHTPYGDYNGGVYHVVGGNESTHDDAYIIWKNFYREMNPVDGNVYEGTLADIVLEEYHRELIHGYYFVSGKEECGKIAMYRDALQYDKFLFYHSVVGRACLYVYDEKLIPEARAKIDDYVSKYKDEFKAVKIRQENNQDLDPIEEE